MVRNVFKGNPVSRTNYKADVELVTGMGVVRNYEKKTVGFPAAETADDIYVVDKERVPVGEACARTDFSDYEEMFNKIAKGEFVKIDLFAPGTAFAVDAVSEADAPVKGKRVAVGTDGLWKIATVPSRYLYTEDYVDNGHKLIKIEVLDTAATN
ncbi:MAG: hypothetical protein ACI4WS_13835 [Oscillospiraceae bacterium]